MGEERKEMNKEEKEEREMSDKAADEVVRALDMDSPAHFDRAMKQLTQETEDFPKDAKIEPIDQDKFSCDDICKECKWGEDKDNCPNEDVRQANTCWYCYYMEKKEKQK